MANINFQIDKSELEEWKALKGDKSWKQYFEDLILDKYEEKE